MTTTNYDNRRQRERAEFCYVNSREDAAEAFMWQDYVAPAPLPQQVEAHELRKRRRHSREDFVDRLDCTLPKLARALRDLKKGFRDRNLDQVLSRGNTLRPLVTRVRISEAVLWPGIPLLPDWKQYSGRIREEYGYYNNVGRALEFLAWGQALDDQLEVRTLHGQPIYCGPRLRDWGRQFWAQPLSLLRCRQERRAIEQLRSRVTRTAARRSLAAPSVEVLLRQHAEEQTAALYQELTSPRLSWWSLLGQDGTLRHTVYRLRLALQALGVDWDCMPARRSQYFLGGGDAHENHRAWLQQIDHWWRCRAAQVSFSQAQAFHFEPHWPGHQAHIQG